LAIIRSSESDRHQICCFVIFELSIDISAYVSSIKPGPSSRHKLEAL
jgi:hypothetical protein